MQLVQGEKLAIRDEDVFRWVRRFEKFPKVQVIDLDAAMGSGDNLALVRQIAGALSCRVGGGIRTVERARDVLAAGAQQIIAGSSLFKNGAPDLAFAQTLRDAVGRDRVIAAVDSRGGHVVIHGWKTTLPLTAVEAVRALEPYCDEFLYTHVDTEGLMGGTNLEAIRAVRDATTRRVTAAGGITTQKEIDDLHALGVDAVVGMAIYNEIPAGRRPLARPGARRALSPRALHQDAKAAAPERLFTYVNFPPTEFLDLSFFDVCAFNVYLHREPELRAYLARLQHIAGHKPLLLAEAGADSIRESAEGQAGITAMHIRAAFEEGACGAIAFAWTDEWWRGGHPTSTTGRSASWIAIAA